MCGHSSFLLPRVRKTNCATSSRTALLTLFQVASTRSLHRRALIITTTPPSTSLPFSTPVAAFNRTLNLLTVGSRSNVTIGTALQGKLEVRYVFRLFFVFCKRRQRAEFGGTRVFRRRMKRMLEGFRIGTLFFNANKWTCRPLCIVDHCRLPLKCSADADNNTPPMR